jgi:SpoVK/Ycf46/Vps4 family AAA+-type ATPase
MLLNRGKKKEDGMADASVVWKTLPVLPVKRDLAIEQHERTIRRRALNAAIMMRAVGQLGATLQEPVALLEEPGSSPARGRQRRLQRRKEPEPEWSELVIGWKEALDLASTAVGRAATSAEVSGPLVLTWQDIQAARAITIDQERRVDDILGAYLAAVEQVAKAKANSAEGKQVKEPAPVTDPVVETLKKDKGLTKHEKRLLPCIVDATKLATSSFNDVHLPYKTIDAIRTVISLPLLFPEAFQGGILKDHVTSGALLFGPPGTGKTLLARAIAAESGARMLAIQPSDVNDMWVGEGEKLVKAVFNLARRLSPCVVFIDEVDSLFAARSARDSSGGSKAHNQILTEFMQEMDGLSSASANRDKRVVVVGATNRPFDLDDAILRRLPRRLLVDLPTLDDRKAILRILLRGETLAADVDIDKLAANTEGFSGSDLKRKLRYTEEY